MSTTPVIDVGGTHVTAALVDTERWRTVDGTRHRVELCSGGSAAEIIGTIAAGAARAGDLRGSMLGVSMPGPFDYVKGIGRFRHVGKFDALDGVDVKTALLDALSPRPRDICFVNDASAFGLGDWVTGAARGADRVVAITLGTGVGSVFLDHGIPVSTGPRVPPDGSAHLLRIGDCALEDVVSRRAIIAAYRAANGNDTDIDVHAIAERARAGDSVARTAFDGALRALGAALRPWLVRFDAELLVVGGGITASWELVAPPLKEGLTCSRAAAGAPWTGGAIVRSADPEGSILVGAAWHAITRGAGPRTPGSHR